MSLKSLGLPSVARRRRAKDGGEAGIRTLDTAFRPYNGLANRRLQPLGHLTFAVVGRQSLVVRSPVFGPFVASPVELPRTNDRQRTAGDLTTNGHFSVSFRPCACRRPCARLYALACERRLSSRASCRQISSRPCDRRRHHPRLRPCERRPTCARPTPCATARRPRSVRPVAPCLRLQLFGGAIAVVRAALRDEPLGRRAVMLASL